MTTRRVLAAVALCLAAWPAAAQQRPPEAPARPAASEDAPAPSGTRPPERPESPPPPAARKGDGAEPPTDRSDTDAPPDDTAPDDSLPSDAGGDPPPAREVFGPPMPPAWWVLRESDTDHAACRLALSLLGTVYEELLPLADADNPDCGIARPIRVERILPDLTLQGGAVMRCDTARALGFWARDFLRPAAATLPGAPRPTGLQLGTTYDCRARIGTGDPAPKLSEHALGNAIDIAAFEFAGAPALPVQPREETGDRAEAFQRAVRGAACLFFTTVLGPGANAAHANHLHLDVAARRGGWRLCE